MADFKPVLETRDLGPGQRAAARAHGRDLVIVNVGQTYYALEGRCPKGGTHLGKEGQLMGDLLVCPRDQWAFDVRTGRRVEPKPGPALQRYAIKVEENRILVGPAIAGGDAESAA